MKFSCVCLFVILLVWGFFKWVLCWDFFPSEKFPSNRKSNSDANEDFYTSNRRYSGVRVPVSIMIFLGDQDEVNLVSSHFSQCIKALLKFPFQ